MPLFAACAGPNQRRQPPVETEDCVKDMLTFFGLLCFIEGLPYMLGPGGMKKWLRLISSRPVSELRGMGGLMMVAGLILVYMGRHHLG